MRNYQEKARSRQTKSQIALLVRRVIRIIECDGERITEYRRRFVERHAVFLLVCGRFLFIPLEYHSMDCKGARLFGLTLEAQQRASPRSADWE